MKCAICSNIILNKDNSYIWICVNCNIEFNITILNYQLPSQIELYNYSIKEDFSGINPHFNIPQYPNNILTISMPNKDILFMLEMQDEIMTEFEQISWQNIDDINKYVKRVGNLIPFL